MVNKKHVSKKMYKTKNQSRSRGSRYVMSGGMLTKQQIVDAVIAKMRWPNHLNERFRRIPARPSGVMLLGWDLQDALDWMDDDLGDENETMRAAEYMVGELMGELMRESLSDNDINQLVKEAEIEVTIDQLHAERSFYINRSAELQTVYQFVQPIEFRRHFIELDNGLIQENLDEREYLCEPFSRGGDPTKIWVSISELKENSVGQCLSKVPVVQPQGCPARFIASALHLVSNDQNIQRQYEPRGYSKHQQNQWRTNLILQKLKNKYTGPWFADPVPAPPEYFCDMAFTTELMRDPVIAADGHTYERASIMLWLQSHDTSPTTSVQLANTTLTPNYALRQAIQDWISKNPNH